jgi:hypothetical protein
MTLMQVRQQCIDLHAKERKDRVFQQLPSVVIQSLRTHLSNHHARVSDVWAVCRRMKQKDDERNGLLHHNHFQRGLASMGYVLSLSESQSLFNYIDENNDGLISLLELQSVFNQHRIDQPSDQPLPRTPRASRTPRAPRTPRTFKTTPIKKENIFVFPAIPPTKLELMDSKVQLLPPAKPRPRFKKSTVIKPQRKRKQPHPQEQVDQWQDDFLNQVKSCEQLVQSLQQRVTTEFMEWTNYWNEIGAQNAIVIQQWIRRLFQKVSCSVVWLWLHPALVFQGNKTNQNSLSCHCF